MTRNIKITPRELIKHLEWTPGTETPKPTPPSPPPRVRNPVLNSTFSIADFLGGSIFYDASLPLACVNALNHAGNDGIVLTMPEMIAAKATAGKDHAFWKDWYTVNTEEDIGIDKKGLYVARGEPVLVVVHGGGILNPERIEKAYKDGLNKGSAIFTDAEFDSLLEGKLSNGGTLQLYKFDEIQKVTGSPHQFGVVMPYALAQGTKSGYHQKKPFLENPLVLARAAGSLNHLELFYERAKASDNDLGNYHPFNGRDASVAQGRVLFLFSSCGGLDGDVNLSSIGRFVGVCAGGAPAPKK